MSSMREPSMSTTNRPHSWILALAHPLIGRPWVTVLVPAGAPDPPAGRRRLQRLLLLLELTVPSLAHHAGEDSLVNLLLLLGGGWLSMMVAIGGARLATARNWLARLLRRFL
jgi:hypothetical protein